MVRSCVNDLNKVHVHTHELSAFKRDKLQEFGVH